MKKNRRDLTRSARGDVVNFDQLIENARAKPVSAKRMKSEIARAAVEEAKAKRMSGFIPAVPETKTPAEATQVTVEEKKADPIVVDQDDEDEAPVVEIKRRVKRMSKLSEED